MKQEQYLADKIKSFLKRNIGAICLWLAWAVFFSLSFANVNSAGGFSNSASLRYDKGITQQTVKEVRRTIAEKEVAYWPTFWRETSATVRVDKTTSPTTCLQYSGDGSLVLPVDFVNGFYPGALEEFAVAISTELSWKLFKNYDCIGKTIKLDNVEYTIKGVFTSDEIIVLASLGERTSDAVDWQAAEVTGDIALSESLALEFAKNVGLGEPDDIIIGGAIKSIVNIMAFLPLALIVLFVFIFLINSIKWKNKFQKTMVVFAVILAFVVVLPLLLALLPPDFVPTKWSDFNFWSELFKKLRQDMRELLYLTPKLKDVFVKELIIVQAVYTTILTALSVALCSTFKGNVQTPKKEELEIIQEDQPAQP